MMERRDRIEFEGYLRNCTDRQVYGVYDKEHDAGRIEYADLAIAEMRRRGLELPWNYREF